MRQLDDTIFYQRISESAEACWSLCEGFVRSYSTRRSNDELPTSRSMSMIQDKN